MKYWRNDTEKTQLKIFILKGLKMIKTIDTKNFSLLLLVLATSLFGQNGLPKIYSGDAQKIFSLRKAYLNGELKNENAIKYLKRQADKLLSMTPLSVTDKEQIPPSGDKHDYMSMGKYWWPDPNTKDGLPYIRKDGEVNPEVKGISDATNIGKTISAVEVLSTAFYITNDSKYSFKASQILHVMFIDEKSKMNPNLNYAQFVPGRNEGRGSGIIDVHGFYRLIDAISLLENANEWMKDDDTKIRSWFEEYLLWLQTSKNGLAEAKAKNNHGTWYDVQIVSILLFLDRSNEAKSYLESVSKKRIDLQIKEDGKQLEELKRTKAMSYTLFNLKAYFKLSVLADKVGLDLWNYNGKNGGSIRKALDYFLPFVQDSTKWEYQQIESFKNDDVYPLLVIAKKKYDEKTYGDWIRKIFPDNIKISIQNFL